MRPAEYCAAAVMIAEHALGGIGEAQSVSLYLPIGSEADTLPLIDRLAARGVTLAMPHVTSRTSDMRFLAWQPGDALFGGPMGLRQPAADAPQVAPDAIVTPLLAFDEALNRLGYGAGHYDRAFARFSGARRIGLAWAGQQVDRVAVDPWDVPLHGVATEDGWIGE